MEKGLESKKFKNGFFSKNKKEDTLYQESSFVRQFKRNKILIFMLVPAIAYFFLFSYLPMSGFIIINTVLQMGLAILISEIGGKFFKKITQTAMFLPYFISWVVVGMIAYNFLNVEHGTINALIAKLGGEKINFYGTTWVWPIILVFFSAWKNVGYGTILYLAAIMGIDTEIYEAAEIDGANIFQRIFRVTIPCLVPTLIILTLLAVGNIFRGDFQMFYQLVGNNGPLFNTTDVIDTFTFRSLIQSGEVGMSAAAGLYQSVFCFITIVFTNFLVKRYDPDYSLF